MTAPVSVSRRGAASRRLSFVYVVFPAGALIVVWGVIRELPPLAWPSNLNWLQIVAAAPWWLGVAAAPGYLYAWSGHYPSATLPSGQRLWVFLSLAAALCASVAGTVIAALAIIPLPFTVGSVICSASLLRHFDQRV